MNKPCDYCKSTDYKQLFCGRWITYCDKCRDNGGLARDKKLTYDNEFSPSLDSGDFSMIDGDTAEMMTDFI